MMVFVHIILFASIWPIVSPDRCGFGAHCAPGTCTPYPLDNGYNCTACTGNFAPDQCRSCLPGYVGTNCTIMCSSYCKNGSCSESNTSSSGYSCSSCVNANFADDQCTADVCVAGFSGNDCTIKVCSNSTADGSDNDGLDVRVGISNENINSNENNIDVLLAANNNGAVVNDI